MIWYRWDRQNFRLFTTITNWSFWTQTLFFTYINLLYYTVHFTAVASYSRWKLLAVFQQDWSDFVFIYFRPTLHTVFMLVKKRLMWCCPMEQGYLIVLPQILSKFLLWSLIVLWIHIHDFNSIMLICIRTFTFGIGHVLVYYLYLM